MGAYGPYLRLGRKKAATYFLAFLDDASRLAPFAGFCQDQSFDSLKTVFKEALCRRGIAEKVYTDNGKIYRSGQLQFVCVSLGIALIHAKPYDAAAKGKIERFFLTVKERFYSVLAPESLTSLEALNRAFATWLEKDYNGRLHSATAATSSLSSCIRWTPSTPKTSRSRSFWTTTRPTRPKRPGSTSAPCLIGLSLCSLRSTGPG